MITTIGRRQLLENIQNKNQEHASKGKGLELTIDELIKGMKDLRSLRKVKARLIDKSPMKGKRVNSFTNASGAITRSTKKGIFRAIRKH